MNKFTKKGIYTLVYIPKKLMGEKYYYTQIKIGRTGVSFKDRFQGYKGSDKIIEDVTVHLLPLEIPPNCSDKYGFEDEEKFLKQKVQSFVDCNSDVFKTKTTGSEYYEIRTERAPKFIQIILDTFEIIDKKNKNFEKVPTGNPSILSSLWKYAYAPN